MIVVVMGVSGAGKTTVGMALARALGAAFVEGDEHHSPANVEKMAAGQPLTDEDRAPWLRELGDHLRDLAAGGRDVVLACSALRKAYRDVLRLGNAGVSFVFLDVPHERLRARMEGRAGHFMPTSQLADQLRVLEPPGDDEAAVTVTNDGDLERVVERVVAALG